MLKLLVTVMIVAAVYQAARRPTHPVDEAKRTVRMFACTLGALLALCWV